MCTGTPAHNEQTTVDKGEERDASGCIRRHRSFALASVLKVDDPRHHRVMEARLHT